MMHLLSFRGPVVLAGSFLCAISTLPLVAHEGCPPAAKPEPAPVIGTNQVSALPPLPSGVVDLEFKSFFKNPVGPRGLEMTETLRALDGKKVRLVGHMVRQCHPEPGRFLFAAVPVIMHEHEYGQADELPASTVLVQVPHSKDKDIPFTPGRLALTGQLHVASQAEADGRVFHARLTLDAPEKAATTTTPTVAAEHK
jgi:hypothetical protein